MLRRTSLDTGEIIEIVDYQPESTQSTGLNLITWVWQDDLDPKTFGSPYNKFDIWVPAIRRVKA
jgi:hypothetical protein